MAVEADIVAHLATEIPSLVGGVNLFEGPMTEAPDACVAVASYASEQSDDYVMSPSLTAPGYEVERFQVMVRDPVKSGARTLADAIHAKLDNLGPVTLSTRSYFHVMGQGAPFGLGQDLNLRWRFVANYAAQKARG